MAEIIDLDALVPPDIIFKYQGRDFTLPGDISTEAVFGLFRMYQELQTAQTEESEDQAEELTRIVNRILDMLLGLFKVRDPKLEGPLPFGVKALPIVMQNVLERLGVEVAATDPLPPPARIGRTPKSRTPSKIPAKSRR